MENFTKQNTSNNSLLKIIFGILFVALPIAGFFLGMQFQSANKQCGNQDVIVVPRNKGLKACTMEARLCPDGSYVGRTGPNCEFAPCPSEKSK